MKLFSKIKSKASMNTIGMTLEERRHKAEHRQDNMVMLVLGIGAVIFLVVV